MKLYIIPGFGESIKSNGYREILNVAKKKGYETFFLSVQLKNHLLSEIITELSNSIDSKKSVIIGFSNGALISYILSTVLRFNKVIICSISDIVGEDTKGIEDYLIKIFSSKTANELIKYKYSKSKSKQLYFINGQKEKYQTDRVNKLIRMNKGSKHLLVRNTEHKMNRDYIRTILSLI